MKIVKPNLSEYGSIYGDLPVQQTIDEMEEYFKESAAGDNRRDGDTGSRSGDSSFISGNKFGFRYVLMIYIDSDTESEMGKKHKNRIVF